MRLILLSNEFYQEYGNCREVLQKPNRPYVCLEMEINGVTYAIPFRHHIKHKYAFITYSEYGLDYTKSVVVVHRRYIACGTPQIDQREFDAIKGNEQKIYRGLCNYIKLYKKAMKFRNSPHYANILRCSALQHFEEYL